MTDQAQTNPKPAAAKRPSLAEQLSGAVTQTLKENNKELAQQIVAAMKEGAQPTPTPLPQLKCNAEPPEERQKREKQREKKYGYYLGGFAVTCVAILAMLGVVVNQGCTIQKMVGVQFGSTPATSSEPTATPPQPKTPVGQEVADQFAKFEERQKARDEAQTKKNQEAFDRAMNSSGKVSTETILEQPFPKPMNTGGVLPIPEATIRFESKTEEEVVLEATEVTVKYMVKKKGG